ncbi:glycoside hydrolase family 3 protein [Streptomyces sp. NPDC057552]|uniref:glycoside hydrolase family 3 protein n=1 Tax=Streptomyces sp. NPDC057552 TaxID=3350537 RepID=UPI00368E9CEB
MPVRPPLLHHHDGTPFRDLNHNGTMEPYEDPRLPVEDRVADLLARMTLEEKAGLMCHGRMLPPADGTPPADGALSADGASDAPGGPGGGPGTGTPSTLPTGAEHIAARHINHFALMAVPPPAAMARWNNHVQDLAAATRLGIPVTLSSDPRHGFAANPATAHSGEGFSAGPEPIGLAATDDPGLVREFAAATAAELRAVGIRLALHPMADLATEPRWARISGTFGEDADRAGRMLDAYIRGMQGDRLDGTSVACMVKHFPGHGPQALGEDAHFAAGRAQAFPGRNLAHHLRPFEAAFAAGAAQVMPCYAIPSGTGLAEVGAGYNRDVVTGLLRERYGFDGVVCTDFNALTGMEIPGLVTLPARAWGVEHLSVPERLVTMLDAGVDQLGGETCPELIVAAVRSGAVGEERIDASVRRVLRDKFRLGLFEDPYVDPERAAPLVGTPRTRRLGRTVQRRSLVGLSGSAEPFTTARRTKPGSPADTGNPADPGNLTDTGNPADPENLAVYAENIAPAALARYGRTVATPEEADVAVLRLAAPYEHREGLLERHFHSGSLEFPAEEAARLRAICAAVPTAISVFLDRPAVLAPLTGPAGPALLIGDFGADDDLVLDAVFGGVPLEGVLPFDLPSSMRAVAESREDVPFDTAAPLWRCGHRAPAGEGAQERFAPHL